MGQNIRRAAWSAVLALGVSGCAASPYYVSTSQKAFLPAKGGAATVGEASFLPDATIFETPVGYRRAARLDQPVSGSIIGKRFAFAPGDMLVSATISGASSANVPASAVVMCGTPNVDVAKTLLSASTLGVTSVFNRTGASSQVCLIDADRDGRVEEAILAGIKSTDDADPVELPPAAYRIVENEPIPGESYARLIYRGQTGLTGGHISFDLMVLENGEALYFNNVRTKVSLDKLPQRVTLMGTLFTVKSYNPADGRITLDIVHGLPPGEYGVHAVATRTYIPVYIPRR